MDRPRFFVGLREIGDSALILTRGLRELDYRVHNVVWEPHGVLVQRRERHDRYLPRSGTLQRSVAAVAELVRQIPRNDVFVFNFSCSFLGYPYLYDRPLLRHLNYIDLPLLKALGKIVIVIVNGDDLRSVNGLVEDLHRAGHDDHARYLEEYTTSDGGRWDVHKRRTAAALERHADHIFARPIAAQFLTKPYNLLWIPLDLRTVEYHEEPADAPLVVHAPSSRRAKGTYHVLDAVERLEEQGHRFRFELLEGVENWVLKEKLTEAEIVLDQFILPGYGLLAVEAMASGCAVLGSAIPGYNGFPDDCPVVTTTPETLGENLRRILEDAELRRDLARQGRRYVEEHHDHVKVAREVAEAARQAASEV